VRICVALLALAACKGSDRSPTRAPAREGSAALAQVGSPGSAAQVGSPAQARTDAGVQTITTHCPQQPFAESTPLAEASGAAWLTIDGKLSLVVVADSGNDGAYAILDPDTGETREQGKLPLGKRKDDDLEGLAGRGDRLYGLTSNGLLRVWRRAGTSFALIDGPYAIGRDSDGTTCPSWQRCAIDYEGLALAPAPRGGCAGFACSKGEGTISCLTEQDGRFAVDRKRAIAVTRPGTLADCAFDERGTLWVADNVFGLDQIYRIERWDDVAAAKIVSMNAFGVGFPEVIAVRGDVIYRMSDTGGAPSLLGKFRCSDGSR
jgi:hypothetical protein